MIVLYTDFGLSGPYLGQVKAVLHREAPGIAIVDLCADAPTFDPYAAAYLLGALTPEFPPGSIFLGVVDPGVGTTRGAVAIFADGRWYVGPDNGLFEVVARRANEVQWWNITWRPQRLSASFHGRDLFAPVVAELAKGRAVPGGELRPWTPCPDWPDDRPALIYRDHYGNCMTGLRMTMLPDHAILEVADQRLSWARTFGEVPKGTAFWYENSIGLIEVAVNCGNAATLLGLKIGDPVQIVF
ncbi:S-adenosyl-L-methionine hydrolase (adenosine-forming) [Gammaproteobacteria bacterium]